MSSFSEPSGIPRSRDGAPNWAADTDPVGPPLHQREEGMSTAEFGDPNGQAPAPAPEVPMPLTLTPPAPVEPLVQPPVAVETPAVPVPVSDMRDVPLGTLIFREGLLTEEQLEEALQDGMRRGKRLGEVLLERGLVSEADLGRLLAGQKGLPFVQLDAASIDPAAVRLLPVEKARLHSVLPIGFQDGLPVVAVADPSNDLVVENVRRALNCEPHLVVAAREALHRQIEVSYAAVPTVPEPTPVPAAPAPVAAPVVAEPVTPVVAAEPVAPVVPVATPVAPVAPPPVVEPQPANGDGLWLGTGETALQPEPVVQPQPVVHHEPLAQPEPAVQPEPAQPVLETPAVPAAPEPLAASFAPAVPDEPVAEPVVETPTPAPQAAPEQDGDLVLTWSVVLRLADGARLDIGTFHSSAEAKEHAKNVVEQISTDSWPFFESRFIRPEAIVSVDLLEPEGRWLGSAARRAWDAPQPS